MTRKETGDFMKLLFASDSFKGSLTSQRISQLLTLAAKEVFGECECIGVPVADGGEGTVHAVTEAACGEIQTASAHDPLMNPIKAEYGVFEGKAIIEMSAASGLTLVPEELRDPMNTSTFGTGELILDALDRGCREIAVAIGGSATNDGGTGCMTALGARFLDENGAELSGCGRDLLKVKKIDLSGLDKRIKDTRFSVLCDVKSPLCGKNGATYLYSEQKGAAPKTKEELERGMINYRDLIKTSFGVDCDKIEGAGAAGGLGAALKVFLNAQMRSGIDAVLDMIHFNELLEGVDLVITGEGKTDAQSCRGKVVQGVGRRAKARGIPVVCLSGSLGKGAEELYSDGISAFMTTVNSPMTLGEAMKNAESLYFCAAKEMFRLIKTGRSI